MLDVLKSQKKKARITLKIKLVGYPSCTLNITNEKKKYHPNAFRTFCLQVEKSHFLVFLVTFLDDKYRSNFRKPFEVIYNIV